jgi:hypothetical protein
MSGCLGRTRSSASQIAVVVAVDAAGERAADDRQEGVEDVGQGGFEGALVGQGTRIGLVLIGAMAVELQLIEDAGCGGGGVKGFEFVVPVISHGERLLALL